MYLVEMFYNILRKYCFKSVFNIKTVTEKCLLTHNVGTKLMDQHVNTSMFKRGEHDEL